MNRTCTPADDPPCPPLVSGPYAIAKPDRGKPPLSLVPGYRALAQVARALDYGNREHGYTPGSWRSADVQRIRDAKARHHAQWLDDPAARDESGQLHLAHDVACGLMLLWHAWRGDA